MPQQLMLSSDKKRITVAPGAKTEFTVTIQNLTTLLDDVAVRVAGVDPGWVQVVPAHVPVFAQGEASVRVSIQPPADPARAVAGLYVLQVSGQSQELAGQQAETSLELEVQLGGDYRIEVGAGSALNAQEATFSFKVINQANAALTLRCSAADPQNTFWYKFDPFQLMVPPGGEAAGVLSTRARQSAVDGKAVVFTLSAQGEWAVNGMAAVPAPAHQVNGQWGQAAALVLGLALHPYTPDANSARYKVMVSNPDTAAQTVLLEGSSAERQLNFQFDPPQLNLGPQASAVSTLLVWPAAAVPPASASTLDFWVTARATGPQIRPGSVKASYILAAARKKRPDWLIPAVVAVALLALACAATLVAVYVSQLQ